MTRDRRPTYQGRLLPRPGEELADQGLGFDVETLLGRRRMLQVLGLGAAAVGLAACSDPSSSTGATSPTGSTGSTAATDEIPEETAGPYPGDGSNGPDVLERSGVVRSDIRSSFDGASGAAAGVPMTLELTVKNLSTGAAYAGAAIYVWHCDREGRYSMYSQGVSDENYLRGVQIVGDDGTVTFTSIFPGCYQGRWPHVHFEVYPTRADITDATTAVATSQVALPKEICTTVYGQDGYAASVPNLAELSLDTDLVFRDDGGVRQLATVTGDVTSGYRVALTANVDPTTRPAAAGPPGGDGPPGSDGRPRGARPNGGAPGNA